MIEAVKPGGCQIGHHQWVEEGVEVLRLEHFDQRAAQLTAIIIDDDEWDITDPAVGAAAGEAPGYGAHTDSEHEWCQQHQGERGAVAEDEADVFPGDPEYFSYSHYINLSTHARSGEEKQPQDWAHEYRSSKS